MIVDVRPTEMLRGARPLDLAGCLGPIVETLCEENVDLSRLRLVCDWVQYPDSFRGVVDVRPFVQQVHAPNGASTNGTPPTDVEVAVDLSRCTDVPLRPVVRGTLGALAEPNRNGRLYLEPWTRGVESRVWELDSLYWRYLGDWEQAKGHPHEQAPHGADGTDDAVEDTVNDLFAAWDDLAARGELPDELHVVELGVGDGSHARTFLDELARLDAQRGTDYYRRLQYLMCDYSDHVLGLAGSAVVDHLAHVGSFVLDATTPSTALKSLRGKVFLVYVSHMYGNLPSEEVAHVGGHAYRVETRAYLPSPFVGETAAELGCGSDRVAAAAGTLVRLGPRLLAEAVPDLFADPTAAARFWQRLWHAVRLEERYVALPALDRYQLAEDIGGDLLRPLLEADGDIRMHASNGAAASLADTLPLLHPYGRLLCHDVIATSTRDFRTSFRGPGKHEGSVVSWVNGPLLRRIAARHGYDVAYTPHRSGSGSVTMTARPAAG